MPVHWNGTPVHAMVPHLGLIAGEPGAPGAAPGRFIEREVPRDEPLLVAGDFNDWGERLDAPMRACGLHARRRRGDRRAASTFPSRVPVFALDRVYARGLRCRRAAVPRGRAWARMSDHLPLVAELELA